MAKTVLGFDIGAYEMKVVQWDGSRVRRTLRAQVPDSLVRNGQIVSYEAMGDFIRETLRSQRLTGRDCAVILPPEAVYLRRMTMPLMTVEQLQVNLPYEFRDFLTMDKDKYFYDYIVNSLTEGTEERPGQMDLTAAAVPKAMIQEYRDMFRRAKLRLHTALPAECAFSNLLRRSGQAEGKEFCFLDLGHGSTRIHIFTAACFEATRVLEVGLEAVDAAIADAMNVDRHVANTYKQTNYQDAQTLDAVMNVYNAIALDLRKALNFYAFNNRESDLQDIWCCGGGAFLPALRQTVAQAVELQLHTAGELLPAAEETEDLTIFAAAAGAAIS